MREEVLAVQKRVLGEEHPDTLSTASYLANIYAARGKYAEAEATQAGVLAASKRA